MLFDGKPEWKAFPKTGSFRWDKMENNTEVLITRKEAAFLKAHVETIRLLTPHGDIPSLKIGNDWRFYKAELRRWSGWRNPKLSGGGK